MKKIILTLLTLIFAITFCFSQDMITKKSGEDIEAKILEVTTTEIKFKKSDNINGPIFTILKSDVLIVRYENGTKDIFNEEKMTKTVSPTNSSNGELKNQNNSTRFGIKGGLNLSKMHEQDDDDEYSDDYLMNPGFHLGVTVDISVDGFLSFESGLIFTTKGMKIEENSEGVDGTAKLILYYLDIPLLFKTTFELNDELNIFAVFGPYYGVGLSEKVKAEAEDQGITVEIEEDIEWGDNEDSDLFKRLDMGLSFGGGIEVNSVLIGVFYDLGLYNPSPYEENGYQLKHRVL
ncbi:MAG: hypothetical protein ACI81Y_001878, partial [Glaciecola sp.]